MYLRRSLHLSELWEELRGCYKSLCIRCMAIKEGESWKNLLSIVLLSRRSQDEIRKETEGDYLFLKSLGITEIQDFGIFYEITEAKNLPNYIDEIQKGKITLQNQVINLKKGFEYSSLHQYRRIEFGEYIEYPSITYEYGGESVSISGKLEEKFLSSCIYSLNEISSQWLKIPHIYGLGVNVIITMPIYFKLTEMYMKANELCIKFKAHKELVNKVRLVLALKRRIGNSEHIIDYRVFTSNDLSNQRLDKDFLICEARWTPNSLLSLEDQVYCRVASGLGIISEERGVVGSIVGKTEFKEPLMNIFAKFIPTDNLRTVLLGERSIVKAKITSDVDFQRAVTWLLSLIGFRVMEFGDTRYATIKRVNGTEMGDVDIFAQDIQTGKLYAIQCTIAPPDPRKIDVIANVTTELRARGAFVEPLIIVRDIATEVKRNARRVKVVDKEDLLRILELLLFENVGEARRVLLEPNV